MQAWDPIRYQLIDIRPTSERYAGMGFVAGSRSLPRGNELCTDAATIERLAGRKLPVLICLSGHRAHGLALALAPSLSRPLHYVEGGLFAWRAAGLPLAAVGLPEQLQPPLAPSEFALRLYAEVDAVLDTVPAGASEPVTRILRRCIASTGRPLDRCAPHELCWLLDLLSGVLLDFEVPRAMVSTMLDRLLQRLPWVWDDDVALR